jgi:hypothetical protein
MRPGALSNASLAAARAISISFDEAIEASAITLPVEGLIIFCAEEVSTDRPL